ncbi:gamma carbonic anhydrase family protein [Bosea sp. PAMC 26642]|uniref:gamma carbonic anhydrase family protein n=1 Tax=Bosea sp. (strain PAMC 26642) TaxID=1792307 RepID=UPI00077020B5|nr:gamma carbonic anhydrase family protein [Bosea sp. PAMC 26642]AMJ60431.1 gamma carbonic anhydrase family protein [Bosea sp. PAMC 26642]
MPLYSLQGVAPETPPDGAWWLAPDAHLIGKVRIAAGVGIWFGAVLRGDNEWIEIGERSNIQEGCVLHTDMGHPLSVGIGCTIGHRAILHGCTIGDNSLVGMGATVLNGAKIGRNCLVGANALVTEGKEFPDNSLIVGSPARAVRTIDDKGVAGIAGSAQGYVDRWKLFAAEMKRLD